MGVHYLYGIRTTRKQYIVGNVLDLQFFETDASGDALSVPSFPEVTVLFAGFIDSNELSIAMRALGFEPKPAEIQKMITDLDANSDGTIDLDEFISLMEGKLVPRPN